MHHSAALMVMVSVIGIVLPRPSAVAATGGSLDPSFPMFGAPFPSPAAASAVAIQPDGRIVAAGYSGTSIAVARFLTTGFLDTSFDGDGQLTTTVASGVSARAVVLQPDGRIVVAGTSSTAPSGGVNQVTLVRYETTGAVDTSFGTSGVVITPPTTDAVVAAMARQADGRLVVVGSDAGAVMVRRYEADGAVDGTFGSGGLVSTPIATSARGLAVVLDPGGQIVVAGGATIAPGNEDVALVRYESDGTLDATFGSGGIVTTTITGSSEAAVGLVRDAGSLVAAGTTGGYPHFFLTRYDGAGALDASFGTGGTAVDTVLAVAGALALQADGKLIVAGTEIIPFSSQYLQGQARIARYDDTGAPDASFGSGGGTTSHWDDYGEMQAIALQTDGRIVVAGREGDVIGGPPYAPSNLRFVVGRYLAGTCGDANEEPGEQCDDGNVAAGDCCSPQCDWDPIGSACDDGQSDLCTAPDACDGAGSCVTGGPVQCPPCEACNLVNGCEVAVRPTCKTPVASGAARLAVTNAMTPAKDRVQWKWGKGEATVVGDFGAPDASDDLALCIFDAASQLALSAALPAGGFCAGKPCWKAVSKGFRYRDGDGTSTGVTGALLKAGTDGKAKMSVDGKGTNLVLPNLATLAFPLRVQLQSEAGQCWEATYSAAGVSQNDGEHLKARSD